MRRAGRVLLVALGAYLIVRGIAEPFVIDVRPRHLSRRLGWSQPRGVLAVHMLPGLVAAALMVFAVVRRRRHP